MREGFNGERIGCPVNRPLTLTTDEIKDKVIFDGDDVIIYHRRIHEVLNGVYQLT